MLAGAEFIVMIHPDYQYDSRVIPVAVEILRLGICDCVLGSRIRTRSPHGDLYVTLMYQRVVVPSFVFQVRL